MSRIIINNVVEIEEVDETWALKLLNESERDEAILIEESSESNTDCLQRPSAIELQKSRYERCRQELNTALETELKESRGFKQYLKSWFA